MKNAPASGALTPGGPAREVDLFARPTDEIHAPIVTISDLAPGQHKLTIEVTGRQSGEAQGNLVVVDAFDVQFSVTVSHWQETDPDAKCSAGWTKSSAAYNWSGAGVSNVPELPVTAQETELPGVKVDLPFRGTAISWIGYRGPDAGIAQVQVGSGATSEVGLYSPTASYQPVVFTATGLADAIHTLTITSTAEGSRRVRGTSRRRCIRRDHARKTPRGIRAVGQLCRHVDSPQRRAGLERRVDGDFQRCRRDRHVHFRRHFGELDRLQKGSVGGTAKVFVDGTLAGEVRLAESYPIEGYQKTVFRADGLTNGPHTLTIEVTNTDGSYVVVDAFDVRS